MAEAVNLYDRDFLAWSEQQAEALRAALHGGPNQLLDFANLAEEIEGLGISQSSALGSQVRRIIHHLLKLEYSSATEPRRGWEDSIVDARAEIEDLLERSPSLAQGVSREIARQAKRAATAAIKDLVRHGEFDHTAGAALQATVYTEEQVLGDWFPAEPHG